MKRITCRADLVTLAAELGVRHDWHEPDEQEVTATTHGKTFDNAGFWGKTFAVDGYEFTEQYVTLYKAGVAVAVVNLATLFAWAAGKEN